MVLDLVVLVLQKEVLQQQGEGECLAGEFDVEVDHFALLDRALHDLFFVDEVFEFLGDDEVFVLTVEFAELVVVVVAEALDLVVPDAVQDNGFVLRVKHEVADVAGGQVSEALGEEGVVGGVDLFADEDQAGPTRRVEPGHLLHGLLHVLQVHVEVLDGTVLLELPAERGVLDDQAGQAVLVDHALVGVRLVDQVVVQPHGLAVDGVERAIKNLLVDFTDSEIYGPSCP
mmetsp:Transcript_105758/g.227947  ORF Transcript_105758/g.227947 Transcript_105758/m.227947 type:complete len:229 (-) Transcript_105758:263-949(-)